MQISGTRHSSTISRELPASLTSFGAGSDVLAIATCTGGGSCGGLCEASGKAALAIRFGSSGAALVSAAACVTGSATVTACTGGVSSDCLCDESGNAASTVGSGLSGAAVVSAAVCVTGSAAVAASALATTALLVAVASRASATSAPAVRVGARRSAAGTAPACSKLAELTTATEPTTQPARTTLPHNATPTVGNRRALVIRSPPKAPFEPC